MKNYIASSVTFIIALTILTVLLGSWYTIDQGERGVVLRNGATVATAEPGLHFKLPIVDDVKKLSVQSRKVSFSEVHTYSKDQQPAVIRISVNYRLAASRVSEVYADYGSEDGLIARLITPRTMQDLKTVFGKFNAETAIQERDRLNTDVFIAIGKSIQGAVIVESIQIENIDFSSAYEQSVEKRMLAEVEVQKLKQNLEREKIQADIVVTQATAAAEKTRLQGEAEAQAIDARGRALRNNPQLVSLVQAEKWDGKLPTTMLPNGAIPMLTLSK